MRLGKMTMPADYSIYVEVAPYPNCGFTGTYTARIGVAKTVKEAHEKIAHDRREMGNTFGGLIDPVNTRGRVYRIFKAVWTEVR